jgi:hypothetical protein
LSFKVATWVKNYPGGVEELAKEYQPGVGNTLAQEAPGNLSEKFASLEHVSGMETLQPPQESKSPAGHRQGFLSSSRLKEVVAQQTPVI